MIFSSIFDRKHKGIETTGIGIFWTVMKQGAEAEAIMYAEAQGIITTKDGRVMATYMGEGIGRFSSPGKVRFHGSVYFRTTSIGGGKLSFLDNTVGVFEYEGDEQGNCSVRVWEWK
jgi:hypothetical protein